MGLFEFVDGKNPAHEKDTAEDHHKAPAEHLNALGDCAAEIDRGDYDKHERKYGHENKFSFFRGHGFF